MQKQGADIPDLPSEFSAELNMVMQSCLAKETWDRPTAEQLADYANQKRKGGTPQPQWTLPEDFGTTTQEKLVNGTDASVNLQTVVLSNDNIKVSHKEESVSLAPNSHAVAKNSSSSWLSWVFIVLSGLTAGAVLSLF